MRYLSLLFIFSVSHANFFIVSDKKGNIIQEKSLQPIYNASLSQNPTEYSFQAMYDLLHKEENLARMIQALEKRRAEKTKNIQNITKVNHRPLEEDHQLIQYAKYFKGGRYIWGGTSPEGFDCSGYVQYLYQKINISLPRTAWAQSKKGMSVKKEHIKKGDLLFFLTDKSRGIPVTHVGIALGHGEFIHAASKKKGIIISSIENGHYAQTFVGAKRILPIP